MTTKVTNKATTVPIYRIIQLSITVFVIVSYGVCLYYNFSELLLKLSIIEWCHY